MTDIKMNHEKGNVKAELADKGLSLYQIEESLL